MPKVKQNPSIAKRRRPQAVIAALVVVAVAVGGYAIVHQAHAGGVTTPVLRLANYITHERLFTTSVAEKNNALQNYPGWVDEGIGFYAVSSTYPNAVPVYRLANWMTHERLFTTSVAEKNNALNNIPGWVYEGIGFYEVQANDPSAQPVYRLANYITHERLFTISLAEKNNALQNYPGWIYEGIGFYAANPNGPFASPSSSVVSSPSNSPSTSPSGDTIYLSPASGSVNNGSNLVFDIHENSGSDPVNAVQANFDYPTAKFSFVSITATTSAFGVQAQSSGTGGHILIARGVSGGSPALTGDHIVATVTLTATAAGSPSVTPAAGSLLVRSTDNTNVLGTITGGTYTIP